MTCLALLFTRRLLIAFWANLLLLSGLIGLSLIDKLMDAKIGLGGILALVPGILLGSMSFALPLAVVTSCTQCSARWRQDGEMTALASGGLSPRIVTRPATGLFLAVALLAIPLFHDWSPMAQNKITGDSARLLQQVLIARAKSGWPMVISNNERLFTTGADGEWLTDLVFTRRVEENSDTGASKATITIFRADRGRLVFEDGEIFLNCEGVHMDRISDKRAHTASFAAHRLPLDTRLRNFRGLDREIATPSHLLGSSPQARFERAHRWVLVALIPLLALTGLRLGWILPWSGKAVAFLVSLGPIALVYIPLMMLCRTMIFQDKWPASSLLLPCLAMGAVILALGRSLKVRGFQ